MQNDHKDTKLPQRLKIAAKIMQYCHKMGEITTNKHKVIRKYNKIPRKHIKSTKKCKDT